MEAVGRKPCNRKEGRNMRWFMLRKISILALVLSVGAALSSATVRGQNIYVTNASNGTIGEYTTSGGTVNASLVSGLSRPAGIAVSGSDLFVTNQWQRHDWRIHHVGSGRERLPALGVERPIGIAVSGSNLFVASYGPALDWRIHHVGSNRERLPGLGVECARRALPCPDRTCLSRIRAHGTDWRIHHVGSNGERLADLGVECTRRALPCPDRTCLSSNCKATARLANTPRRGQSVNASLVSGLNDPLGIAVSGSDLFVANRRQRARLANTPRREQR